MKPKPTMSQLDRLSQNLAGTYKINLAKLELRAYQVAGAPNSSDRTVYSIRLGQKNKSLIFVNHTDYTHYTSNVLTYSWEGKTEYCFSYGEDSYTFTLDSTRPQSMVKVERC